MLSLTSSIQHAGSQLRSQNLDWLQNASHIFGRGKNVVNLADAIKFRLGVAGILKIALSYCFIMK